MVSDLRCPTCLCAVHPMHYDTHLAKCDVKNAHPEADWKEIAGILYYHYKEAMAAMPAMRRSGPDGTERLCTELYGGVSAKRYLGGSDAQMLHDAADKIRDLEAHIELIEIYAHNEHPMLSSMGCPLCEYKDGKFIKSCNYHKVILELQNGSDRTV